MNPLGFRPESEILIVRAIGEIARVDLAMLAGARRPMNRERWLSLMLDRLGLLVFARNCLTPFRHGGFTEGADSDLTDAELRAAGRHRSSRQLPTYAKRTRKQLISGTKKRRDE